MKISVDIFGNDRHSPRMRTQEEVQDEQRRAEARVQRWNESVRRVRELARQWQRDNEAQFGPFFHPVEDEQL